MYTHLEDYVCNLYRSIGITRPEQLNMQQVATNRQEGWISGMKSVITCDTVDVG